MNLEAARSGDPIAALEALRDTLAAQIDTTEAQVHAQLAAQYRATIDRLIELGAQQPVKGGLDELKQRREGRRSTSDASANA